MTGRWGRPRLLLSLLLLLPVWSCAAAPTTEYGESLVVDFTGNDSIADFRLTRVIQDLLIEFAREPSRESAVLDAALDLRQYYLDEGFPEAAVEWQVRREPRLAVEFQVKEGPRVLVKAVEFTGNRAFTAEELLRLWNRQKSGVFATGDPWFVEDDLRGFASSMRTRYRSEGFLEMRVTGPAFDRPAGGTEARVAFAIHEGPQYRLVDVTIAKDLAIENPREMVAEFVGKPYSETAMSSLRLKLRKHLEDRGHPDPVVLVRTRVDDTANTVTAAFQGEAGPKATIKQIVVRGNERTATAIIRRRIRFREGEPYHGGRIDETVQELYLTGLFSRVQITHEVVAPNELRISVDLEEAEAKELALMVGYGSYEGPRAGVILTERNLFGGGQRLSTGVRASPKSYRGDITWTEPQLFASRTALSVTTFLHQREEPSFTDETLGATAALSRRLMRHVQGRTGYTYEESDGSDIDPGVSAPTAEEYTKAALFLELIRDTRDSPIFPTTGHHESIKFEHSDDALGGSLNFDRIVFKASRHIPLSESIGLALGAETGVLLPRDPGLLPIQERFFNGGESTVRSFKESQLGPRAPNGEFEGGEFRNVFNLEARFPLLGPIQWALFADAGNVGREVQDYGLGDMRYALGGGIRFALPIGPLRLDCGVNPDRRPDEDAFVIHFSIGFPF